MISLTVTGLDELRRKIRKLAKSLGKDSVQLTTDQAKKLGISLISITRPNGNTTKSQQQGEAAVGNQIRKVIGGGAYTYLEKSQNRGLKGFPVFFGRKGGRPPLAVNLPNIDLTGNKMEAWHSKFRKQNQRRRVLVSSRSISTNTIHSEPRRLMVPVQLLKAFIKRKKANVGIAKAGWAAALYQLSGTYQGVARWVSRNAKNDGKAKGSCKKTNNRSGFSVTLINKVPWIEQVCDDDAQNIALNAAEKRLLSALKKAVKNAEAEFKG